MAGVPQANEEKHKAFIKIVNAGVGITTEGSKVNEHLGLPDTHHYRKQKAPIKLTDKRIRDLT